MPNQILIPPNSLTPKMDAYYGKNRTSTKGGSVTVTSTTSETTIVSEQVTARVIVNYNISLSGVQTFDNILLNTLDICLVNGQDDAKENGLYLVKSGAWTRHSQAIYGGLTVSVKEGTDFADTLWFCATPEYEATVGTDTIKFNEISSSKAFRDSEESATEKLSFAWELITELACKIESLIADKTYSVVAHADDVVDEIPIPTATAVTIPYHNLRFTPSDGTFADGVFTAGKSGYYDVDCYYYDTKITPPMVVSIGISSTADGACEGDTTLVGSGRFKLQASRKVYLPAGGSCSAVLSHSLGTTQTFNCGTCDEAGSGYISISYCGDITAATNTY